jgi:hypothetical protein
MEAADHTGLFQPLQPLSRGGQRQTRSLRQRLQGQACVGLQRLHQPPRFVIELHHALHLKANTLNDLKFNKTNCDDACIFNFRMETLPSKLTPCTSIHSCCF